MSDIARAFGFGSHEQRLSNEDSQLVSDRDHEVEQGFDVIRKAVWAEKPQIIIEEDKLQTQQVITSAPAQVAGSVINLAAYQERREQTEIETFQARAQAAVEAAFNDNTSPEQNHDLAA